MSARRRRRRVGDRDARLRSSAPAADHSVMTSVTVRRVGRDGERPRNLPQPVEPRRVEKPWGHELIWAHSENYCGKLLRVEAGEQLSLQYHERKDETLY